MAQNHNTSLMYQLFFKGIVLPLHHNSKNHCLSHFYPYKLQTSNLIKSYPQVAMLEMLNFQTANQQQHNASGVIYPFQTITHLIN